MSGFTGFYMKRFRLLFLSSLIASLCPFAAKAFRAPTFNFKLTATNTLRHRKTSLLFSNKASRSADLVETMTNKRLVLVGGGHAHLQVIKGLNHASRPDNLEVVLVDLTDKPCYSGMVPSAVAGIYSPPEALVDLEALAQWAKIEFVKDRVVDIDVESKVLTTKGNRRLSFDAISIDIGSTSRDLMTIPGAKEHTIPTRPITELVRRIGIETNTLKEKGDSQSTLKVAVVGGGAAGIELAMGVMGRWKPIVGESNISVTILNSFDRLFPDETPANRNSLLERLEERNISVVNGATVSHIEQDSLLLKSGERVGFTHCLFATGAGCHLELASSLRKHGLAVSERGWITVNESFQSPSHPFVFAAGDCCRLELPGGARPPPKAGVYAVRAGPVLIENLTRFLNLDTTSNVKDEAPPLEKYVPQKDFLKLLACGDGKALGFRFGIPIYGKWVFELKDAIDRSFMDLFKLENLPELIKGQPYDTSQYDASSDRPPPMPSTEAANLLQRTDDEVDFTAAWNVLRDMAADDDYRDDVLKIVGLTAFEEKVATIA